MDEPTESTESGNSRTPPEPQAALAVGTIVEGKYRIDGVLGSGGMGVVYAATHQHLEKSFALKVLLPELAGRKDMAARVIREARAASATGHPNVVAVTDLGWHGDSPFFVMERLEGVTLGEELRRVGRFEVTSAVEIVIDVLDALAEVHAAGIIHRDLKPANVMLTTGRRGKRVVKVLDFGIAKARDPDPAHAVTSAGVVVGTPEHMAPEQALATEIDHRADVFAAGSLLYTLLTGELAFGGPTVTATLSRLLVGEFEPASVRNSDVSSALDAVIAKALSVTADDRYATALQMQQALEALGERASTVGHLGPPAVSAERGRTPVTTVVAASPVSVHAAPRPPREPADEAPMQLDVPDDWVPGRVAEAGGRAPHGSTSGTSATSGSFNWRWWTLVVGLAAAAYTVWHFRDDLRPAGSGREDPGRRTDQRGRTSSEFVFLMVETTPSNAIVFVDGVQQDTNPVEVPKSDKLVAVRVEAPGYEPRVIKLVPSTARRLTVKLDRSPRSRRSKP